MTISVPDQTRVTCESNPVIVASVNRLEQARIRNLSAITYAYVMASVVLQQKQDSQNRRLDQNPNS